MNYYNDNAPHAAAWLRQLVADGLIPPGDVDDRPIQEVMPDDIRHYTQCHFFAGIGGWPYALALAGWPADRTGWTGSCPCQPFSAAGKGRGTADERHLWPEFARLIGECRPPVVLGEQVASKAGRAWLAAVRTDLEELGYAVGAADLCAAGVGAPHIRQRIYWGAADLHGLGGQGLVPGRDPGQDGPGWPRCPEDLQRIADSPFEPGDRRPRALIRSVDDGVPARVALIRGYGNAIVPQLAAAFIECLAPPRCGWEPKATQQGARDMSNNPFAAPGPNDPTWDSIPLDPDDAPDHMWDAMQLCGEIERCIEDAAGIVDDAILCDAAQALDRLRNILLRGVRYD